MTPTLLRSATLCLLLVFYVRGDGALAQAAARNPSGAAPAVPSLSGPPAGGAPAALPSTTPRPDRTTASYGDWILRCEMQAGLSGRQCEVVHTVLDQRGQTLAQLVARRGATAASILLSAQVGTNVTVADPLRLTVEQAAISLTFRRCFARGCFAEAQPTEAELSSIVPRTEPAKVEFHDGDGQVVSLPVSLRGLTPALNALRIADQDGSG
ncbi:invasion associated locus B family protein [Muricoccus aerilatus]|uniref:invasion associated locus B family protein n=1 Tax=Muricoccus aerilatus TaxID=452982 RepID=UPI0005C13419|nr:invasion associated locus B family protein [Roseomonas aerilata]